MYVKKFKNGKIKLEVKKNDWYYRDGDGKIKEDFYHDELFFNDLFIEEIDGDFYIVDTNTNLIYDYFNSCLIQNPLQYLLKDLEEKEKIYLYPETNSEKLFEQYLIEREEEE